MFLLYVLAPVGHLQGDNLQRNKFIMSSMIYIYMKLKYNVINHNIYGYMCNQ